MLSLNNLYEAQPRRRYVDFRTSLGAAGRIIEVRQPEGDFSTPPVRELMLVEPLSPGIRLSKRWGSAQFHGIAPLGSQWLVPPGCQVNILIHTPHTIRMLLLDPAHLEQIFQDAAPIGDFAKLHQGPFFKTPLRTLMTQLWRSSDPGRMSDRLSIDDIVDRLAVELMTAAGTPPRPVRGGLGPRQIRIVRDMLDARPEATLRIGELAQEVGISPYHFARAFKISFGVAPHRYQKLSRLHRARDLLAGSALTVLEVALAVGYASAESLARLFRAEMRLSPQEYRKARQA